MEYWRSLQNNLFGKEIISQCWLPSCPETQSAKTRCRLLNTAILEYIVGSFQLLRRCDRIHCFFDSLQRDSAVIPAIAHSNADRRRSHINKEIKMWMKTPQTRCFPVCGVYVIWFCYKYRRAFLLFCYSGMPWESSSGFLLDRALEVCFWQLSLKKGGRRACCFVPSALCN